MKETYSPEMPNSQESEISWEKMAEDFTSAATEVGARVVRRETREEVVAILNSEDAKKAVEADDQGAIRNVVGGLFDAMKQKEYTIDRHGRVKFKGIKGESGLLDDAEYALGVVTSKKEKEIEVIFRKRSQN